MPEIPAPTIRTSALFVFRPYSTVGIGFGSDISARLYGVRDIGPFRVVKEVFASTKEEDDSDQNGEKQDAGRAADEPRAEAS